MSDNTVHRAIQLYLPELTIRKLRQRRSDPQNWPGSYAMPEPGWWEGCHISAYIPVTIDTQHFESHD
ncbi:MAG: hypothetical protein JNN07_18295 [Verrucomicrobiales bacterium]|nr:hypothetical protein [Verrucomicrobiales bacterium]